jgi:uncharacterized protein YndB with AHSA1/START domain
MDKKPITVEAVVKVPMVKVWEYWNTPKHIMVWDTASPEWETPKAENDLRVGGMLKVTMAAKDKSASFDLNCRYTDIAEHERIEYDMEDGRHVRTAFTTAAEGVRITQTFDPENTNPVETQRSGWQAILDNFKKYAEGVG